MKNNFSIPKFKNEDEERDFWANTDLSKHLERKDLQDSIFPDLKPSSRSISLRLPEYILMRLKEKAHKLNIPYQTLMKQYIAQGLTHGS